MKCAYCNIDNKPDAQFCRSCGRPLTTHNKAWWKEHNMEPVGTYKLKQSSWASLFCAIMLLIILFFTFISGGLIIEGAFFRDYVLIEEVAAGTGVLIAVIIVSSLVYRLAKNKVFVNRTRKKRGLRDNDYIQKYDSRDVHYVLFARGTSESHKFGLFDVQNIRMKLSPIYEELTWLDKGKLLNALKDGNRIVIDINGNDYQ